MTLVIQPVTVTRIITHWQPHWDEIVAAWLLRLWGEQKGGFKGVATVPIEFWDAGGLPHGMTGDEHLAHGTLCVGTGGGMFDEHAANGGERKQNHSATSLVADHLRLRKEPDVVKIISFATAIDTQGGAHHFDLTSITRALHYVHPRDGLKVMQWGWLALDARRAHAKPAENFRVKFDELAGEWLDARASTLPCRIPDGERFTQKFAHARRAPELLRFIAVYIHFVVADPGNDRGFGLARIASSVAKLCADDPDKLRRWVFAALDAKLCEQELFQKADEDVRTARLYHAQRTNLRIMFAESTNPRFNAYVRARKLADILAQRNPKTGHVLIFADTQAGVDLQHLARVIRSAEQQARGTRTDVGWDGLAAEAAIPGAECWYFVYNMLLNGSQTAPAVEPTRIPWERLQSLVQVCFN